MRILFAATADFSVTFAALPVPSVVSGAAVQQSGMAQSKVLDQGHEPCVVLSTDLCAVGLGKRWENDAAGAKGNEVKVEGIRISSAWVFCEIRYTDQMD